MDNYTKAVLAVVALCVLALPVKAEEKVWYCEMTAFAETRLSGQKTYKPETFKLKVSSQEAVFGTGGFFDGVTVPLTKRVPTLTWWESNTPFYTMKFDAPELHVGSVTSESVLAISARCDDF